MKLFAIESRRIFSLAVFVCFLLFAGWAMGQPFGSDEKFREDNSYYIDACKRAVNLPFGGASVSRFETLTCAQLISDFEKQERDGRMKARIDAFMRSEGLEFSTFEACKEKFVYPNIVERNINRGRYLQKKQKDWESCARGVQDILSFIKDQKDFFIKALSFKIDSLDYMYVQDRNKLMPNGASSAKGTDCSSTPAPRDFYRSGRFAGVNDCEWTARAASRCILKLGEHSEKNMYGEGGLSQWQDRQTCRNYIKKHAELYEAFGTGLKSVAKQGDSGSNASRRKEVEINCAEFDPNRQLTALDSMGATAMMIADALVICSGEVSASTSDSARSGTRPAMRSPSGSAGSGR